MSPFCPFREGGVAERGQCPLFYRFFYCRASLTLVSKDYDDVNKAEETKEELCDSGLEISGQEGSDNSADVTDDSKKKKAEAKQSNYSSHPLDFSWRVLIVWTDPEMHREVRR